MNAKVFFVSFILSAGWIIFSDYIVNSLFPVSSHNHIQHFKGTFFVLASNLVVAWFVQREINILGNVKRYFFNRSIFFVAIVFSTLWILITDYIVAFYFSNDSLVFQTAKGLFYVLIWSLLVSWLAQKEIEGSRKLFPLMKASQMGLFTSVMAYEMQRSLKQAAEYVEQIPDPIEKETLLKGRIAKNIQSLKKTISFFQKLSRNEQLDSSELSGKILLYDLLNEVSLEVLRNDSRINLINEIPKDLEITGSQELLEHLFGNLIGFMANLARASGEREGYAT